MLFFQTDISTNFRLIFDWAEVWFLFFPLIVLVFFKIDRSKIFPINVYFIAGFFLNILIDLAWKGHDFLLARGWNWVANNNILYNVQSVGRVILFTIFFSRHLTDKYKGIFKWSLIAYSTALLLNFTFFESVFGFSSRIFSAESLILLTICILYFFSLLTDDSIINFGQQPAFWLAIGLSLYEASNFSIFLFYTILMRQETNFAVSIWDVHNIFFGILCIFSAKAFYECRR